MNNYNNIYETLMQRAKDNEEELVGFVAYSLYKREKAEFFDNAAKKEEAITDEQKNFYHKTITESSLAGFEEQARTLIVQFANDYLEKDLEAREHDIVQSSVATRVDEIKTQLASAQTDIETHVKENTKFSTAFWAGIASCFAFAVLTAIFTFVVVVNNIDTVRNVLNAFSPPTPTPSQKSDTGDKGNATAKDPSNPKAKSSGG